MSVRELFERPRAMLSALLAAVLVVAVATGCSSEPERSVGQFCSTYNTEKSKFVTKYAPIERTNSSDDGGQVLANLLLGLQSLGDASVILDKLDRVAPNDIEPDVAAVRDSWKDMQGTLGDEAENAFNPAGLVGAAFKGVLGSLESNGSWTRLGAYIEQNCSTGP